VDRLLDRRPGTASSTLQQHPPVSRLTEFIDEELSAAEADDTDYTGGGSSATDYGHAMTDNGYDYGAGGLGFGGDQQWGTNVDYPDTGLDLD
ncbi:hypothetical protein, partial [Corynebacterium variabile]|uniref:hypothetical protein n=1 Tax=Corynebacterium variabile TaxID=1727 RepID=UPI001C3FC687